MLLSQRANTYLHRLSVAACAISLVGFLVSIFALLLSDLSGSAFRFFLGFGSFSTLLLAGSPSIRTAYLDSIQRFREAKDHFENRMR